MVRRPPDFSICLEHFSPKWASPYFTVYNFNEAFQTSWAFNVKGDSCIADACKFIRSPRRLTIPIEEHLQALVPSSNLLVVYY